MTITIIRRMRCHSSSFLLLWMMEWLFLYFLVSFSLLSTETTCCSALTIHPVIANTAGTAWAWYLSSLKSDPLLTKSITSSGIMTVSDILCQKLVQTAQQQEQQQKQSTDSNNNNKKKKKNQVVESRKKKKESSSIDLQRALHAAITGLIWSGPITHFWYGILDKIVTIKDPIGGLAARLLLDSIIFSPVTVSGFFFIRSILEGTGIKGWIGKLETKLVPTVIGAWQFWPAANAINFGFVPPLLRVLYMNVLSLFWTGYLSYVNSKKTVSAAATTNKNEATRIKSKSNRIRPMKQS